MEHSYSTRSKSQIKSTRGKKRSFTKTYKSTSSQSGSNSGNILDSTKYRNLVWKWSCSCKGKKWDNGEVNRSWVCDELSCNNCECEICLRNLGYDDEYIESIHTNRRNFFCIKHRIKRSIDTNTNNNKKVKKNRKNNSDEDYYPSDGAIKKANTCMLNTTSDDLSSANELLSTTNMLFIYSSSDPNDKNKNKKKSSKSRKKKTPSRKSKKIKTTKLTQSDMIREMALSIEGKKDGLSKKNQLIAKVELCIYDSTKRRLVRILMINRYEKGLWMRTTDKFKKYVRGGGPKKRWKNEEIASRIAAIGFLLENHDYIMEKDEFQNLYCISNGLDTPFWFASTNVAAIIHYLCFDEPIPFRKPLKVKDKLEGIEEEKNISKYDGLDNYFKTYQSRLSKLNVRNKESHNFWAETMKEGHRQLLKENNSLRRKRNENSGKDNKNEPFGISSNEIVKLNQTCNRAMNLLEKQVENNELEMKQNRNSNVKSNLHLQNKKKKHLHLAKRNTKPITRTKIYSLDCTSGSEADYEDEDDDRVTGDNKFKKRCIIVTNYEMIKQMQNVFLKYLKTPTFERAVLMICMEGMCNKKIQRNIYDKYTNAIKITDKFENVMQILATGVFDLCPEIDEKQYRKKWN